MRITTEMARAMRWAQLRGYSFPAIAMMFGMTYRQAAACFYPVDRDSVVKMTHMIAHLCRIYPNTPRVRLIYAPSLEPIFQLSIRTIQNMVRVWRRFHIEGEPPYMFKSTEEFDPTVKDPIWEETFRKFAAKYREDPGLLDNFATMNRELFKQDLEEEDQELARELGIEVEPISMVLAGLDDQF